MLKHKHLRHLAYFVEIVRAGSIRNAALKAKLSAAVMSEALSNLETHMKVTLIKRVYAVNAADSGRPQSV